MCFVYSQYKKYIFNCKYTFGLGSDLWITCLHLQVCVYVWCCVTVKMGITSSSASTRKLPMNKKQWQKHVRKTTGNAYQCICTGCGVGEITLSCPSSWIVVEKKISTSKAEKLLWYISLKMKPKIYPFTYYKVLHWDTLPQWEKCNKMWYSVGFSGKTKQGKDEKETPVS